MLDWEKAEKVLGGVGVILLLVFPIVSGIPGIGYVVQTAAMCAVMYFAYRRLLFLLVPGLLGSLLLCGFLFDWNIILFGMWAVTVLPGTAFGRLLRAGVPIARTFIIVIAITMVISIGLYWGSHTVISETLDASYDWAQGLMAADGGGAAENQAFVEAMGSTIALIKRLMPALMTLSAVGQVFVGWVLLLVMLRRLGEFVPSVRDFIFWKMPDYYVFVTGAIVLFRLLGTDAMKIFADNFILFFGFFYALFGFSVFEFYLKKTRLSLFMRVLFYIGILLLQLPGLILAATVGLFDSYFDFRKVKARLIG
ncbi:MAG: DUF2232 domain-containing protein [candidate division Zixibacteria bacterium]|nr:DUF2232 domain-containing protein [candidate division Zixibacteria bacterium]